MRKDKKIRYNVKTQKRDEEKLLDTEGGRKRKVGNRHKYLNESKEKEKGKR